MRFSNWFHYALMALAGVFFISPKISVLFILLLGVIITIGAFKNQFTFKGYSTHVIWATVYLLYAVGAIFSRHPKLAGLYLENKLSILLFPLFFSFKPVFEIRLRPIIWAAMAGYVLAIFSGVVNGYSSYSNGIDFLTSFTSVFISPIHHPTYMSTFGIVLIAGWWQTKEKNKVQRNEIIGWLIAGIIFLYAVLCLSLSALIFMVLLGCFISCYWILRRLKKLARIVLMVVVPLFFMVGILNVPSVKTDMKATWKSLENYIENPDEYVKNKPGYKTGNEIRLVMWMVTIQEIIAHPLGVGTGNVDEVLSHRLLSKNQKKLAEKDENGTIQFNPHNQFLQTSLEVGIVGGLILLLVVSMWFKIGWNSKNWMLLILSASLAFNGLFESMLQRQSGIVFYSFWSVLLIVWSFQNQQSINQPIDESGVV